MVKSYMCIWKFMPAIISIKFSFENIAHLFPNYGNIMIVIAAAFAPKK